MEVGRGWEEFSIGCYAEGMNSRVQVHSRVNMVNDQLFKKKVSENTKWEKVQFSDRLISIGNGNANYPNWINKKEYMN